MNEKEHHLVQYLVLLMGLGVLFFLFVVFMNNHDILKVVSGSGSIFYVLWGLSHHAAEGRLNKLIAFEYILVGSLAFLILFTALSF